MGCHMEAVRQVLVPWGVDPPLLVLWAADRLLVWQGLDRQPVERQVDGSSVRHRAWEQVSELHKE